MKIVGISDTHNKHNKLKIPECDILIHAGDATGFGRESEVRNFARWFNEQPAKHLIFVPGNHEKDFEDCLPHSLEWFKEECPRGHILINESIELEGVKFYGSPVTPWFYNWAWNVHRGEAIKKYWDLIPEDTNVLITHGMPNGILDTVYLADGTPKENVGCQDLLNRIKEIKPNIVLGGHLHGDGSKQYHKDGTSYYNLAICCDMYMPTNPITIIDYERE